MGRGPITENDSLSPKVAGKLKSPEIIAEPIVVQVVTIEPDLSGFQERPKSLPGLPNHLTGIPQTDTVRGNAGNRFQLAFSLE